MLNECRIITADLILPSESQDQLLCEHHWLDDAELRRQCRAFQFHGLLLTSDSPCNKCEELCAVRLEHNDACWPLLSGNGFLCNYLIGCHKWINRGHWDVTSTTLQISFHWWKCWILLGQLDQTGAGRCHAPISAGLLLAPVMSVPSMNNWMIKMGPQMSAVSQEFFNGRMNAVKLFKVASCHRVLHLQSS